MQGFVESLNVSVSNAILICYATTGLPGNLKERHQMRVYTRWLMRSLNRASEILEAREIRLPAGFDERRLALRRLAPYDPCSYCVS